MKVIDRKDAPSGCYKGPDYLYNEYDKNEIPFVSEKQEGICTKPPGNIIINSENDL